MTQPPKSEEQLFLYTLGFIWFLSSLCSQLHSIFSDLLTHFIHPLIDGQFVEWLLLDAGFSKCHIPEQQRSTKEQLPDICHPVRAWNVWNELPKPCCTKTDLTPWLFTFTFAANLKKRRCSRSSLRKEKFLPWQVSFNCSACGKKCLISSLLDKTCLSTCIMMAFTCS